MSSTEREIEKLIQREARLLDTWQLDEWLSLYTEDAIYWVPIDETSDPKMAPSIMYDNATARALRVEQLIRQGRLAQTPLSRTVRFITNVDVTDLGGGKAQAFLNMMVVELRPGDWRQNGVGSQRSLIGSADMEFRLDKDGWRISNKTIVLLGRDQPIESLTFIL